MYSNNKVTIELCDVLAMTDADGRPFDLWDFDYPSYYDGADKKAFEQKVIDHYFFNQIGCETVARFKHNFKTRMREIMPYYIQLYKSVDIMDAVDDPFGNVDIVETYTETSTGNASGTSSASTQSANNSEETNTQTDAKSTNEHREHKFNDTPQGTISTLDNYLTEATLDTNTSSDTLNTNGTVSTSSGGEATTTGTAENKSNGTIDRTITRKGNQGVNTYAHDMIEYRQSFINVDMQVIGALRDLFLLIY